DIFTALIKSIVSQQISKKAAATVWSRVRNCFGDIIPEAIAGADIETIQACGLSGRKSNYIKGIGQAVVNGDINLAQLYELSDDEVIKELSSLKGVGVWTAEMILIS